MSEIKSEEIFKKLKNDSNYKHEVMYNILSNSVKDIVDVYINKYFVEEKKKKAYRSMLFNACMEAMGLQLQAIIENNLSMEHIKEILNVIENHRIK